MVSFKLQEDEMERNKIREPFVNEELDLSSSDSSENSEDNWLNDITEEDIKRASIAKEGMKIDKTPAPLSLIDKSELIRQIIPILLTKETIPEALQRLNKKQPPPRKFTARSRKEIDEWHTRNRMSEEEIDNVKKSILLLSSSSSTLYSSGYINIYEIEKETIIRL